MHLGNIRLESAQLDRVERVGGGVEESDGQVGLSHDGEGDGLSSAARLRRADRARRRRRRRLVRRGLLDTDAKGRACGRRE